LGCADEPRAGQQDGGAECGGLFFFVGAAGPEWDAVELADFRKVVLEHDVRDLVCDAWVMCAVNGSSTETTRYWPVVLVEHGVAEHRAFEPCAMRTSSGSETSPSASVGVLEDVSVIPANAAGRERSPACRSISARSSTSRSMSH